MRIALTGAGLMGKWHALYGQRAGAELVAVVDRDLAAAQRLAVRFGARAFSAESNWLSLSAPEVVHVCTPWDTHVALSRLALNAGAHVIVEKPVADTERDALELAGLASAQGKLLVPVHQFPFQAGFRQLQRQLPSLGTLRSVEFVTFTAGAAHLQGAPRRRIALEILPHPLALFRALGFELSAEQVTIDRFTDDALELSWKNGPTRLSARIVLCARPTCNELRVAGDQGSALVDLFHGYLVTDRAATSRASKLLRPFRSSSQTLLAASINLASRSWRNQPAYPGLHSLIASTYRAIAGHGPAPVAASEYCISAMLIEQLARG
ncbi:MAG TPA: Gfo/Idh/MocA family oxidoreductase [Polyangiaceae bacterium]